MHIHLAPVTTGNSVNRDPGQVSRDPGQTGWIFVHVNRKTRWQSTEKVYVTLEEQIIITINAYQWTYLFLYHSVFVIKDNKTMKHAENTRFH